MQEQADKLPESLQKLIDFQVPGIDIIHGQLKLEMLMAQTEYDRLYEEERADGFSDSMQSMERKYAEGWSDAMAYLYKLTYDISFAEAVREAGE